MNNGDGLRTVLWLSGCSWRCEKCQNPQTWNPDNGIQFDINAKRELFNELGKDYIYGITFTGGDPLHKSNIQEVLLLTKEIRLSFPNKTIWLYSGYTWEEIFHEKENIVKQNINMSERQRIITLCDVMVDGRYINSQRDITLKWRGSSNQRVIDVQESLKQNKVVLYCD